MSSRRQINIVAHIIGWMLFLALIFSFVYSSQPHGFRFSQLLSPSVLLFVILYIGLYYLNSAFLFAKLYLQKDYALYVSILLLLFAAVFFLQPFDNLIAMPNGFSLDHPPPPPPGDFPPGPDFRDAPQGAHIDIMSIVLFLMVISLSTVSGLVKQWRESEKKAAQAEAEKAQAELSFLKAQINPHFLFNTLNNIYALIITKNEMAPNAVMKLSNIMRYVTDEVSADFVSLGKEIACVSDYIDLQRMRLNEKTIIEFTIDGKGEGRQIVPLIFMCFIENAFKYGISSHEASPLIIHITIAKNNISLFCQNKLFPDPKKLERSGIGINNTRRRLEHLYPGKHLLNITQENGFHTVHLAVQS